MVDHLDHHARSGVKKRLADQGDGTHAEVVAAKQAGTWSIDIDSTPASNQPGSVSGVAAGGTASVATYTPGAAWLLEGFLLSGTGGADAMISIAGTDYYPAKINLFQPSVAVILPRPHLVTTGQLIALTATAASDNTGPADFAGTILGRPQ